MAKIKNPILFSTYYGVNPSDLEKLGVLDPTLNVDTRLFIDPLLLSQSRHPEISIDSHDAYEQHFRTIIKFLKVSTRKYDVAWKTAKRLLFFPEIKWTCLGYGAQSVSGSGSGSEMTEQYIETARQIVALGVEDPDLFAAMALFEEGVGPDRISDMTTNVILKDLISFNKRVLGNLKIPKTRQNLTLRNGNTYNAELPENPFLHNSEPVILVPSDILRALPVVTDWSEIADAASKNVQLRKQVNRQITRIWEVKSRRDKSKIRRWALSGKEDFEAFMNMIRSVTPSSYDLNSDPKGELFWRRLASSLATDEPHTIITPARMDRAGVEDVVGQIIEQFRFLVEERRLSEELYHNGIPRPEKAAQMLFFAVAYAYCKANNLDLTPEADTGNGPVDFKVSSSFTGRVLVEIKLSKNTKLINGYTKQLEVYKRGEETILGYYLVINVGQMGKKDEQLLKIKNEAVANGLNVSPIIFVDGVRQKSASRL